MTGIGGRRGVRKDEIREMRQRMTEYREEDGRESRGSGGNGCRAMREKFLHATWWPHVLWLWASGARGWPSLASSLLLCFLKSPSSHSLSILLHLIATDSTALVVA